MAEEQDNASRTEEPTPRKLEQAREKGDVAKTPDLPSWMSLAACFGVLAIGGAYLSEGLARALLPFVAHPEQMSVTGQGGVLILREATKAAAPLVIAVMAATAIAGLFGNVVQHGFLWTTHKLKPELSKVSPLKGFQRIFGIDGWVQFFKQVLKIVAVGVVAWMVVEPHLDEFVNAAAGTPLGILALSWTLTKALFFAVLAFLALTAGMDWIWQRHRFMQRMRMTHQELKEDFKQSEGDPHIKARQRQLRMEKAKRRMIQNVPKATVVIMNPTHYAVALKYEAGASAAPECVAKGLDEVALKIRAVAEEAGVPVIEDAPLARALYAAVEIDDQIPLQHYEAVAKVIGFVMNGRRSRGAARPLRQGAL